MLACTIRGRVAGVFGGDGGDAPADSVEDDRCHVVPTWRVAYSTWLRRGILRLFGWSCKLIWSIFICALVLFSIFIFELTCFYVSMFHGSSFKFSSSMFISNAAPTK